MNDNGHASKAAAAEVSTQHGQGLYRIDGVEYTVFFDVSCYLVGVFL